MSEPPLARYRIANWSGYRPVAQALLDADLVDQEMAWLAPHEGRLGRPSVFSDAAIRFCLSIHVAVDYVDQAYASTSSDGLALEAPSIRVAGSGGLGTVALTDVRGTEVARFSWMPSAIEGVGEKHCSTFGESAREASGAASAAI